MEKENFEILERKSWELLALLTALDFIIEEKNLEIAKKLWEKILDFWKDKDFLEYILQSYNKHIIQQIEEMRLKLSNLEEQNVGIISLTNTINILRQK